MTPFKFKLPITFCTVLTRLTLYQIDKRRLKYNSELAHEIQAALRTAWTKHYRLPVVAYSSRKVEQMNNHLSN